MTPPIKPLTKAQTLALAGMWPCPIRSTHRNWRCPSCGRFGLVQTVHSELPDLTHCPVCGWARTEPLSWLWGSAARPEREPLEALAYVAVRSWNRDLPLYTRQESESLAMLAARVAFRAGLGKRFVEKCGEVGPIGSATAARRLIAQARTAEGA